jgi:lipoyl(octanoyl) transferase
MPVANATAAAAAYAFINDVLLDALRALGVRARRAEKSAPMAPGLRPCFDAPSAHEIVLGDRKLVGSAQWRQGQSLLQHGSILVRDDQPLISRLMTPAPDATPAAATLAEALGWEPSGEQVAQPLRSALERRTGMRCAPFDADAVRDDIAKLEPSYADDAWTWRR